MSKSAILEEHPKLSAEDRQEIRLCMAELERDDWLDDGVWTNADKIMIEGRVMDFARNPDTSVSWAVAETRLTSHYGK